MINELTDLYCNVQITPVRNVRGEKRDVFGKRDICVYEGKQNTRKNPLVRLYCLLKVTKYLHASQSQVQQD